MFTGFGKNLEDILFNISLNNTKSYFNEIRKEYNNSIRIPLIELYEELSKITLTIDSEICTDRRKCISSIYNDFRYNCKAPIKEYFYIKHQVLNPTKKNQIGFFFDFSIHEIKYGIQIYKPTSESLFKLLQLSNDELQEKKQFCVYIGGPIMVKNFADELKLNYKYNGKTPFFSICKEEKNLHSLYSTDILRNVVEFYYNVSSLYFSLKKHMEEIYFDNFS